MPMRQYIFAIALFAALLPFGALAQPMVHSQEGIALENQILQLQSQVQQLQASGGGGSALGGSAQPAPAPSSGTAAPSSDILGNLLNQVSQLQSQVQQLSGRVDTLQNQVDTQNAATQKEIGDLNFKVTGGAGTTPGSAPGAAPAAPPNLSAGTLGTTPAAPPPPPPAMAPSAEAVPTSPTAAVRAAQAAYIKGDYATAETDARAVLATSKSTPAGYHAQYILAEALYGEGKPQDAALAYDDVYNRDRAGTYAPGSLLGLANSLTDIHQAAAACDTLSSLNSQFPTPPAGMGPRIQAAEAKAQCN